MAKKRSEVGQHNEKERKARYKRLATESVRDIGPIPKPKNVRRLRRCARDLLRFCREFFPERFPLEFSADHLEVIQILQRTILEGGQFALAMPRGSGKTTLVEVAVIFALVYGHRRFVVLIGASSPHAEEMLESIKSEFESNERLQKSFPEVCFSIMALDRIANRAKGQLCEGKPTLIRWSNRIVTLPTIKGSKASGATLRIAGITGRIRGLKHATESGASIRPDLVVIDDPQTDESAGSTSQNQKREAILAGAVLGLAGPKQKIAAIMPTTVIEPGDMADRILDRDRHPEWHGLRFKLLYSMPENLRLWEEYNRIRIEELRAGRSITAATEYYRQRQTEMDAGARAAWPDRYNPDEASAIQHAMNLFFTNERSFRAEYQNDPMPAHNADQIKSLIANDVAARVSQIPRLTVPSEATRVTAMIDVGGLVHFYVVVAWDEKFGGHVIDYGTWPQQIRAYFRSSDANPTLETAYAGMSAEARIYTGLKDLTTTILGRGYPRGEDQRLTIERCLVDANWGESTEVVYQFCRQSVFSSVLLPSHGRGVTAAAKPISEWRTEPGDRLGLNWRLSAKPRRHVTFDSNWWKSFIAARIQTPAGAGSLWLFGGRAADHQLFADHCVAEYQIPTFGRGRQVDQWHQHPHKPDNHWWDCLVGCAVGASERGLLWAADANAPKQPESKPAAATRLEFEQRRREFEARRESR